MTSIAGLVGGVKNTCHALWNQMNHSDESTAGCVMWGERERVSTRERSKMEGERASESGYFIWFTFTAHFINEPLFCCASTCGTTTDGKAPVIVSVSFQQEIQCGASVQPHTQHFYCSLIFRCMTALTNSLTKHGEHWCSWAVPFQDATLQRGNP